MKNFFKSMDEELEQDDWEEEEEFDLDVINLDETAGWNKLDIVNELAKQEAKPAQPEPVKAEAVQPEKVILPQQDTDIPMAVKFEETASWESVSSDEEPEIEELSDEDMEYLSMEDEEEDTDDEDDEEESPFAFFENLGEFFRKINPMDAAMAAAGVLILVIAVAVGGLYLGNRGSAKQVEALAPVGERLETVGILGQDKLLAVADARRAMLEAAKLDAELNQEYEENELSKEVQVVMKMTSVEKDLKIKFVNKKTGKLIGNVPFEVEITDSEKETYSKVDEDKDGIIYLTKLVPGSYSVTMLSLEGEDYADYSYSTAKESIKVKDKIEYQKIDVSDEIKDQSEVDITKEDTAQKEETEAVLTDTVEWVESTKTAIGSSKDGYTPVDKSKIADPSLSARAIIFGNAFRAVSDADIPLVHTEEGPPEDPSTGDSSGTTTIPVSGISLDKTTLELTVDGSETLIATITPSNATEQTVTWSSDAESIAVVSGGTVTAKAAGTATITATAGGYTASCTVTVKEKEVMPPSQVEVTQLTLGASQITLKEGESRELTAEVTPSDATNKTVTWSSDKPEVATVTDGIVSAVKTGTAVITAKAGEKTATCTVTVEAAPPATVAVTGVKLNKTTLELTVGGSEALTASIEPAEATDKTVTWTVDKADIATVDSAGKVTAVKAGTAKITVTTTDGRKTAECTVTVKEAVKPLTMKHTSVSVLTGNTVTIQAESGAAVTWSSSDTNIATVTDKGNSNGIYSCEVKGVKAGTVTITAKAGDKTGSCTITVKLNPKEDSSTTLKDKDGNTMYIKSGDKYVEAKLADYFKNNTFYKKETISEYKYTGWQNLDGKTYFFDKNGNKVTGEQVIQGAKYTFNSDGSLHTGSGILGIDVSTWNGNIDWQKVKSSGVSYVIIRTGFRGSTEGALVEDNKFRQNIKGATAAGLKVGVYFFTQAINEVEAVEEASMVLSQIKGYNLAYPVFIDVEGSGGRGDRIDVATRTRVINAFCQTIQNSGYRAGLYASKAWLNNNINTSSLSGYKIWLAQYNSTVTYAGRYDMWQYSSSGSVAGISGRVDMNLSYMNY